MANVEQSKLIVHSGARKVDLLGLQNLPDPISLGDRHKPIRYSDMVEAIWERAEKLGIGVNTAEYAITEQGEKFFGVFNLKRENGLGGASTGSYALGLRGSIDQSLSWAGVGGSRVFVCDNLAFSGNDFLFSRKSTLNIDVEEVVQYGLNKFIGEAEALEKGIKRLMGESINTEQAKAHLYDAGVREKVIPTRFLKEVHEAYFNAEKLEYPEIMENKGNKWGLHNAFTRVAKLLPAGREFLAVKGIGKHFGL